MTSDRFPESQRWGQGYIPRTFGEDLVRNAEGDNRGKSERKKTADSEKKGITVLA